MVSLRSNVPDVFGIIQDLFRQEEDPFQFDVRNHHGIFVATSVEDERIYVLGGIRHQTDVLKMSDSFRALGYRILDCKDNQTGIQAFYADRRAA